MSETSRGKQVRFYRNYETPVVVLKYMGRGGRKFFRVPSSNEQFVAGGRYGFLCVPVDLAAEFLKLGKNGAFVFAYANPNQTKQVQDEIVRRYNLIQERLNNSGKESDTVFNVLEDFFGNAAVAVENGTVTPPRLEEDEDFDDLEEDEELITRDLKSEEVPNLEEKQEPLVLRQASVNKGRPRKTSEK